MVKQWPLSDRRDVLDFILNARYRTRHPAPKQRTYATCEEIGKLLNISSSKVDYMCKMHLMVCHEAYAKRKKPSIRLAQKDNTRRTLIRELKQETIDWLTDQSTLEEMVG